MSSDTAATVENIGALYGVETAWVDIDGYRSVAPVEVILEVLGRLGAPVEEASDLSDAARLRRRDIWRRTCPPARAVRRGEAASIPLRVRASRASGPAEWRLAGDGGAMRTAAFRLEELGLAGGSSVDGERYEIRRLELPADLPEGYYRLIIRRGAEEHRVHLIVAPPGAYRGGRLQGSWGVFHPLFGLRTNRGAGMGDFRALGEALDWTAARGGRVFGTTPLLAGFPDPPVDPSPYAPASRLFWDERYVDIEAVPELAAAREAGDLADLDALWGHRADELVPWDAATRARGATLTALAARFFAAGGDRSPDFGRFIAARPDVGDYARFLAARQAWGSDWRQWPEPARSGRPPDDALDRRIVRRHVYAQWLAARQIEALDAPRRRDGEAGEAGARLFLDIPLGTHPDGYDVWRHPDLFVAGVAAGAPPDDFFRGGQNWGLPPLHPERIRENGFSYFASVLRHAMGPAGLVRIDHVMQLHRLYWIPEGAGLTDGVYVRYPSEELAAVIALESERARCEVAGEDLGTVPAAVPELMNRWHFRRTSVVGFGFDRLDIPADAVATIETHDMVPLRGLREGDDLTERERMDLLDSAEAAELRDRRQREIRRLDESYESVAGEAAADGGDHDPLAPSERTVVQPSERTGVQLEGRRPPDTHPAFDTNPAPDTNLAPDPLLRPLLEALGASRAGVVIVPLDDLVGARHPQNVPGTSDERPNWRRRVPAPLDSALSPAARTALDALDANRRRAREQAAVPDDPAEGAA